MSFKKSERKMSVTLQLEDTQFLKRGSITNVDPLEEIVSCPIHLDLLDNPRLLPCGHAFCLDCLTECLQSLKEGQKFVCPVCRSECDAPPKAEAWPAAFTHGHIVDYVNNQRVKHYSRNAKAEGTPSHSAAASLHGTRHYQRRGSLINKADMLKMLAKELATKGTTAIQTDKSIVIDELNKLLTKLKDEDEDVMQPPTQLILPASPSSSEENRRHSYDIHCAVEFIRHHMKKCCEYTVQKEKLWNIPIKDKAINNQHKWRSDSPRSPCVDSLITDEKPKRVVADEFGMVSISTGENNISRFTLSVGEGMFYPIHLKIADDSLFVSGLLIQSESQKVGLIGKFSFEGKIISLSQQYPMDTSGCPSIYGFDVDADTGEVTICKPSQNEISILNPDLTESDRYWVFHEPQINPYYVCRNKAESEIWATCPQQGTIVILNEVDGRYSHFGADKIFGSEPSHIICTTDSRVCFLDDKQARVFWIKKSYDYLCIQRISFSSKMRQSTIRLIQAQPLRKMLIASDKSIYYAKPLKSSNTSKCTIL